MSKSGQMFKLKKRVTAIIETNDNPKSRGGSRKAASRYELCSDEKDEVLDEYHQFNPGKSGKDSSMIQLKGSPSKTDQNNVSEILSNS
jgi:hypothetical protein